MKRILIISPYFPPNNTPDLHRIRIMLPHLLNSGWYVDILSVDTKYTEAIIDPFIEKSIPKEINIYKTKAFNVKYTRKFGLGNLGIRSFYFLYKKANKIIKTNKPDLIFFSTTVFTSLALGPIWKRKYKIPFVIDMQDPWRNDYYLQLPKNKRPKKFWFDYKLNKILEKYTIPKTDGIISVTQAYIDALNDRYKISDKPFLILPLGAASNDFEITKNLEIPLSVKLSNKYLNIVYTGVIPENMLYSIEAVLQAIAKYNNNYEKKIKIYFIGTNYAPKRLQKKRTISLAKKLEIEEFVYEETDRVSYFEAIKLMQIADILLLPGTTDADYTASKLYPYILSKKPILVVFNEFSNLREILERISNLPSVLFNDKLSINSLSEKIFNLLKILRDNKYSYKVNQVQFQKYTDKYMTKEIEKMFEKIISKFNE